MFDSGSRREVVEICALRGHYSVCSGNSLPSFPEKLIGPNFKGHESKTNLTFDHYRRFGTNYLSHLQGPRNQNNYFLFFTREGEIVFAETSVRNYQYLLHNNPDVHTSNYYTFIEPRRFSSNNTIKPISCFLSLNS
jgi:hypothetical protein